MDDENEFDFGSDALDTLPQETLQELETEAITRSQKVASGTNYAPEDGGDDEYGLDDEDVIDLDTAPVPVRRTELLKSRPNYENQQPLRERGFENGPPAEHNLPHPAVGTAEGVAQGASYIMPLRPTGSGQQSQYVEQDPDKDLLRAQIRALELENETLQQARQDTHQALQTKAGETALLRRKLDTLKSESDKRLQQMQEQHKAALSKQQSQLELAIKDKKQLETNNRFLEHDLKHRRSEALRPAARRLEDDARSKSFDALIATPRKNKTKQFGDGFADNDVMMVSPSKTKERSKLTTPKKLDKRKRSADQSPSHADIFDAGGDGHMASPSLTRGNSNVMVEDGLPIRSSAMRAGEDTGLLNTLLNHKRVQSNETFIELLSKTSVRATPNTNLSSHFIHSVQIWDGQGTFAAHLINALLSSWKICLKEPLVELLSVQVDAMRFILALQRPAATCIIVSEVVPLLMQTIDLVTVPVGEAHAKGKRELEAAQLTRRQLIDLPDCLELLASVAMKAARPQAASAMRNIPVVNGSADPAAVTLNLSPAERFWRAMAFDFTLVLLLPSQSPETIRSMLTILSKSCLKETFGTIHCDKGGVVYWESQAKRENDLVDRLIQLLFEKPKPLDSKESWSRAELIKLRLLILELFMAMCRTGASPRRPEVHCGALLAKHAKVIGSLFKLLNDSVAMLYEYPPPPPDEIFNATEEGRLLGKRESLHTLTTAVVNTSMRVIHHLLTNYAALVDIRQKLAAVHGGQHKYLVGLARLAFSDQLVMEAGIEDAVCEAAHEILDGHLTFEEGESLIEIFSTPVRRSGPATGTTAVVEGQAEADDLSARRRGKEKAFGNNDVDDDDDDDQMEL